MAVRISRWLEAQGFTSNPFEYWEADREPTLSSYFVQAEWFDALRGDTRTPRSAVLFAPRGCGKSSHRIQIARLCGTSTTDPALIVPVTEFDWLPASTTAVITEQHFLRYIVSRTARILWEHLQHNPAALSRWEAEPQPLLQLHGLLGYAPEYAAFFRPDLHLHDMARHDLARWLHLSELPPPPANFLLATIVHHYQQAAQSDILHDLVYLVQHAGFASIYILIDRVDEDRLTEHNIDATLARIHPLISNLHLLEFPGIACKFFLPDHLRDVMLARRISRIGERIPTYVMTWQNSDLADLLVRRLAFYSRPAGTISGEPVIHSFQDLCEPGAHADQALIAASRGSPRRLIMLAGKIIAYHCARIDSVDCLISRDTLVAMLDHAIPAFYLDSAGYIWLGGQKQSTRLPRLTRLILEYLWANRHRYVTRDELVDTFYTRGQQAESIQRVVSRLRELIEPQVRNSKNYIDFVDGLGYRLVNVEEAPM